MPEVDHARSQTWAGWVSAVAALLSLFSVWQSCRAQRTAETETVRVEVSALLFGDYKVSLGEIKQTPPTVALWWNLTVANNGQIPVSILSFDACEVLPDGSESKYPGLLQTVADDAFGELKSPITLAPGEAHRIRIETLIIPREPALGELKRLAEFDSTGSLPIFDLLRYVGWDFYGNPVKELYKENYGILLQPASNPKGQLFRFKIHTARDGAFSTTGRWVYYAGALPSGPENRY